MTLTNSDVVDGTITQSEMGYTKAVFKLKKGVTVSDDERIEITEEYTSLTSTTSAKIFDGFVTDITLTDVKDITTVSKQDEVERIQPVGTYEGLTGVYLSDMINRYKDYLQLNSYGPTTWDGYFDAPYNFSSQTGKTGTDIAFVDLESGTSCSINNTIDDTFGEVGSLHNKVLQFTFDNGADNVVHKFSVPDQNSGTVEFWFLTTDVSDGINFYIIDKDENILCMFYINTDSKIWHNGAGGSAIKFSDNVVTDSTWYRAKMIWNGDNTWDLHIFKNDLTPLDTAKTGIAYWNDDINANKFWMDALTSNSCTIFIDAYGESWDNNYDVDDNASEIIYNLPATSNTTFKQLSGGQSLQSLLTEGAITEQDIWAIAPDGDIRWHDGSDSSGVTLDGTQKVWDVSAKIQVKRINRVVLKGAGGLESIKNNASRQSSSGQIIIYKDYRADITNQADLDKMAQSLLNVQKDPPLTLQLSMQWEAKGWIQVGETIHIDANSYKYNKSSSYIPAGDYRIHTITYHMANGIYNYIELDLQDGLHYIEQKDKENIEQNTHNANQAYGGTIITGSGGSGSSGIGSIVEDLSPQLGGDLDLNGKNIVFPTTPNISDCLDEDNMSSNSATKLATQQSIKAYADLMLPLVGGQMSGNITMAGSETVDDKDVSTLGTDAEAHAYVEANALTMENDIAMGTNKITGLGAPSSNGEALRYENISNEVYDPDGWEGDTTIAPSKQQVKDVFVSLTGATIYMGTYTPGDAYPATGIGYWYLCDTDGYTAAPGGEDNTPARWYEVGDWIIWNEVETRWDILRNTFGDNVITVAPGDDIQVAIDEIEAVGEGIVFLAPGTHILTATLTINNVNVDIVVKGAREGTTIDCAGDRSAFIITNVSSCTLQDFVIDARDTTNLPRYIIQVNEANDNKVVVENIRVLGDGVSQLAIRIDSDNCEVLTCIVDSCLYGIDIQGSTTLIRDNIMNSGGVQWVMRVSGNLNTVIGNHISPGANSDGMSCDGDYNVISSNIFNDGDDGLYLPGGANNTIIGNHFYNQGSDGIEFLNGDNNLITGNYFFSAGAFGIEIDGATDNTKIGMNHFLNNVGGEINNGGTNTILFGDNTAYGAGWNGDLGTPTKNAVYDKVNAMISNAVYGVGWNAVTTIAGSKNAIWDALPRIKTGSYTGNGALSKLVTVGNGLTVEWLVITRYTGVDSDGEQFWFKAGNDSNWAYGFASNAGYIRDNRINAMGNSYFYVDDDGANEAPNKSGDVYHYVAFCQNTM